MNRRNFLISGTVCMSALTARAQTESSTLEVQVSYTGSGKVDESHKVYVALWDTPDFIKGDTGGPPIAMKGMTSKTDVAKFSDVQKNPVYVSLVYDPSGQWDGASTPPTGASLGLYAKEPGTPAPIQMDPGKTTKITVTFDDSYKMP